MDQAEKPSDRPKKTAPKKRKRSRWKPKPGKCSACGGPTSRSARKKCRPCHIVALRAGNVAAKTVEPHPHQRTRALGSAGGPPRGQRGRHQRTADPADPALAERQAKAYDLRVQGMDFKSIGSQLNIAADTASLDVRLEAERRALDNIENRRMNQALSMSRMEAIISRSLIRVGRLRFMGMREVEGKPGQWEIHEPKLFAFAQAASNFAERLIVQAQKQIDMVTGTTVALPAGVSAPPPVTAVNVALFIVESLPPGEVRERVLRDLSARAAELGAAPIALNP